MKDTPIVVPYDPAWPQQFAALAAVYAQACGNRVRAVHHVGSTAIPGMCAKPIIDIDLELAPGVSLEEITTVLAALGYEYEGDLGIPGRYAYRRTTPETPFTEPARAWPPHHLYVCPLESPELARHLLFRDRLRNSGALCREYTAIKREALLRAAGKRQVYVAEKERLGAAFFQRVLNS
jgi:GrpB-like predicted nucleotidyltransferase (UPF0157 family)